MGHCAACPGTWSDTTWSCSTHSLSSTLFSITILLRAGVKILWTWQCITICTSLLRAALCSVIYPRSTWCSAVHPCWDCVQRYIHIVKVFRLWLCSIISIHVSIIFNNLSILWCVKQPIHVMDGVQLSFYRVSLKNLSVFALFLRLH